MINGGPINGAPINALYAPIVWTPIFVSKPHIVSRRYSCRLDNGTTSETIPISSIVARLVSGNLSTIQVVVPDGTTYATTISSYADDDIIITAQEIDSDGNIDETEWPAYHIDTLRFDHGAKSYSVTINATRTQTYAQTRKWAVTGMSYYAVLNNGNTTIRCSLNKDFSPNDIAILPDLTEKTVTRVTLNINPFIQQMELTA